MTDVLALVQAKLDESKLDTRAAFLVAAALLGDDELSRALDGDLPDHAVSEAVATSAAPSVYLRAVRVAGFRGIGPEATLELEPGPGLTVVVGRNGSGKSSFAEAVEFAFTGSNRRWDGRSIVWKEGWRNLHQPDPARIELDLAVEGKPGVTRLVREWKAGADLDDHESWVQPTGEPKANLATTGWQTHLDWYRPFLPYNELGAILDQGPTTLYDAMTAMLGLDHLVTGQQRLKQERVARRRQVEAAEQELADLRAEMTGLPDERVRRALEATSNGWDLDALEALVTGRQATGEESELPLLRQLASLTAPDLGAVSNAADHLRIAAEEVERVHGSEAGRARETARLLRQALDLHSRHEPDRCPVCGEGRLDESWRTSSEQEVGRLLQIAEEAEGAHRQAQQAASHALDLLQPPPPALRRTTELGLGLDPTPVLADYQAWLVGRELAEDLAGLAEHLETAILPLIEQVEAFREAAADELDRRESAWRPIAVRLASWLERGRLAVRYRVDVADLDAAERWLKRMSEDIRDERFAPIGHRAQEIWRTLRLRSNVELGSLKLEGASNRRRVALDVTVDGVPGAALSVMSQGELHALALSLFLPRATLEDSAFRFVVIDDPVQSMDPARVDGLARVLEDTAIKRQVVVFTHDDRLAESVRRLGVPARILEVTRGPGSAVEVRPRLDPVERYLDDARAVAATEGLPERLAGSVVPAFCRMALEAACAETVRRRRLQRGQPHAEVEQALLAAGRLNALVALALFDDPTRGGEVLTRLNTFGRWAGDVFQACNRGTHVGYEGDLAGLIRDAGRLADQLRSRS